MKLAELKRLCTKGTVLRMTYHARGHSPLVGMDRKIKAVSANDIGIETPDGISYLTWPKVAGIVIEELDGVVTFHLLGQNNITLMTYQIVKESTPA